jgi:ankyrin repeat protein
LEWKLNIVRLLLDRGANLEAAGRDGKIALHAAAWGGYEAMVEFLLDRGANLEARLRNGRKALEYASSNANNAAVPLLQKRTKALGGYYFKMSTAVAEALY